MCLINVFGVIQYSITVVCNINCLAFVNVNCLFMFKNVYIGAVLMRGRIAKERRG